MRLVHCVIGGVVLCGSFFIALWLIDGASPERGQRISEHYNDLPKATLNAGLARNSEQERRYERIDEILAQRQPTRTPKGSESESQRFRAETQSGHKILAKKHPPDEIDALLRKM